MDPLPPKHPTEGNRELVLLVVAVLIIVVAVIAVVTWVSMPTGHTTAGP